MSAATRSATSDGGNSSRGQDEEAGESSINYEENPMHTTATSTTGSNGMETRPMREWLAYHLPALDAPSVFAVHQAFDNDGIKTFNDLVECIKGKVIDMSEIKNYTRAGKLSKMDTLAIIKAIEAVTSTSTPTAVFAPAGARRASVQTTTASDSVAMSNPMHVESVMIVEAMNAQTSAIIEAQQKASYDTAVNLAKLLKVEKAAESL